MYRWIIAGVLAGLLAPLASSGVDRVPRAVECFLQTAPSHSRPGPDEDAYHQTSGTVERVRGGLLVLKEYDGSMLVLRLEPDTRVLAPSGASLSLSHLREGTEVRASYIRLNGQDHAIKIDVLGIQRPKTARTP